MTREIVIIVEHHGSGADEDPGAPDENRVRRPVSRDVRLEVEAADRFDARPESSTRSGQASGDAIVVLLVDDDTDMRRYIRRALRHMGDRVSRVIESTDGRQALALLDESPVGLVISDVVMPVLNGYEMTRAIRQHERHAAVPILLITGEGSLREAKERALSAGAQAVLFKPFNAHDLCLAVEDVLAARPEGHEGA